MEIFDENQNQNIKKSNIHKSHNEEANLKSSIGNNSELIQNESKPSDDIEEHIEQRKEKKISPQKCKFYQFVGRTIFLFLDKYSNPLFIIGPHWPLFICLTSAISIIMLYFYLKFWPLFGFKTKLFGALLYWTFVISYTYTSLINPGFPRNTIGRAFGIPKNDYYYCEYCGIYLRKCSYGSHCEECQICIEKYDHHCVWTGHCIGKNNLITFYIFITSVFLLIFYFGFALFEGMSQ